MRFRRSAGAYVLFPGTPGTLEFRQYVELIPGLGAFPLRPGSDSGSAALGRFLADVLLHAADQATAEERSGSGGHESSASRCVHAVTQWTSLTGLRRTRRCRHPPGPRRRTLAVDRGETTEQCVVRLPEGDTGRPFRAEEAAAQLMVLSGEGRAAVFARRGPWTIVDHDELHALGHPAPNDGPALLCPLAPVEQQPDWLAELPLIHLLARAPTAGAPVLVDWSRLVRDTPTAGDSGQHHDRGAARRRAPLLCRRNRGKPPRNARLIAACEPGWIPRR